MRGRTLSRLSRRGFLGAAAAAVARPSFAAGAGPAVVVPHPTDVRVEEVRHRYEEFRYRTPIKFGGREVDRVTLLNVDCVVRTARGAERRRASARCRSATSGRSRRASCRTTRRSAP